MSHIINMVAFERRCIRSGCVALLAMGGDTPFIFDEETRNVPRYLSRAPCRRGASSLSVQTLFMIWGTQK